MRTTSHRRLQRALKVTVAFAALTAIAVLAIPDTDHPPERIATTASTVTTIRHYTGPVIDRHRELAAAIGQAQLAAFYEWASSQPPPTIVVEQESAGVISPTGPAPEPSGDALTAIAAHFPDLYDQAVAVARCESSLIVGNISSDGANWGLFQINVVHRGRVEAMGYSWSQILDANVNAAVARAIYDEQGWRPWACRWAAT